MGTIKHTRLKFSDLVFMEDNPRQISEADFEALAESIRKDPEFFENRPCLVNHTDGKYLVYAGFQRAHAAHHRLGWADIPCSIQADVPEAVMRERAIRDNTHQGTWNADVLSSWDFEVPELRAFGVPDFVFGEPDNSLNSEKLEAQEDDYEIPDEIKTDIVTGDLFEIGPHRLLCGDSTSADDVGRLMNGEKAEICFTSPPYNLGSSVGLRNGVFKGANNAYAEHDDSSNQTDYLEFLKSFQALAMSCTDVQIVNIQSLSGNKTSIIEWLYLFKDHFVDVLIWTKTNPPPAMAEKVVDSGFEFIYVFDAESNPKRSIRTASFNRGTMNNVYSSAVGNNTHTQGANGATFSIPFAAHYVGNLSNVGDGVFDPFLGSGTTMVVAHQLKRNCYGMEKSPQCCQLVLDRMLKLDPTLEIKRNGQPYNKTGK